ncbi:hypothetical protein R1flu_001308 [Riccia fluitans]|uniref:Serpin domain-containing protein n=1 Tax=Riccia fluitans TaxID=41844 RepID=A0ABD1Y2X4_9MARC
MYILLPNSADGLLQLEKDIDAGWFVEQLPELTELVPVGDFLIPRFSISSGFEARQLLRSLGLHLPFDAGKADLSGMQHNDLASGFPPLYISNVFHKAIIEVNEEGTVAAAATGEIYEKTSMSIQLEQAEDFKADHPFLFLLGEDHSGTIMFIGRVVEPT